MKGLELLPDARTVELPGVRLHFRDSGGEGPVIVFLHANTGTSESWAPQLIYFEELGYRVVAFDRRGRGCSIPKPDTGPQPGSLSEDLANLVSHLRVSRFFLVGVAGGGFHTLDYAAWRPDQVLGIVVAASNGAISEPEVQSARAALAITSFGPDDHHYLELSPTYRMTDPQGVARWRELERHAKCQGSGPLQPLRDPNTYEKLQSINCPALVLAGCADLLAPPALMRLWARHLRDCEFQTLAGAGHAIAWEQPDRFNTHVKAFIARVMC